MYGPVLIVLLLGICHGQNDSHKNQTNGLSVSEANQLAEILRNIFGPAPADRPTCRTINGDSGRCSSTIRCHSGVVSAKEYSKGNCTSTEHICCPLGNLQPDLLSVTDKPTPAQNKGCGWRNQPKVNTRIMTEEESNFAEFPWMVAVNQVIPVDEREPNGKKIILYTSGGSLIHPSVVLTTAHQLTDNMTLKVRAGEWNTKSESELYVHQDRTVARVIRHELFNNTRTNLYYDVALLVLDQPFELMLHIGTICLPPPMQRATADERCISTGWGKDKHGKNGRYQSILKKVELPVVDRVKCQKKLRRTPLGPFFKLHDTFMCAGGEADKDTCKGDGGSPLVCPISLVSNRYMQNGIVAWGVGCGNTIPAVYVDVGYFRLWIDKKMVAAGFETTPYTIQQ